MADAVLRELGVSNGGRIVFDRSRVRVLVCDPSPSPDVVDLLRRCSYQVVAVQNARQVMEVLRAGMAQVDLILTEVELPNKKGFKMLKYLMKEEQLKQIPVIMMSSRDEMAVVGKCLRLGAVDYLVKPLRTNELLNLWTHMWRRRRMLGMTEKCLLSGSINSDEAPLDVLFADTSESNTNSTDLFSDDSKDQERRSIMDGANSRLASTQDKAQRNTLAIANSNLANNNGELTCPPVLELTLMPSSDLSSVEQVLRSECMPSPPKKTELKIGKSSAFLSYTKVCNREVERPREVNCKLLQTNDGINQQSLMQGHEGNEVYGRNERPTELQHGLLSCVSEAQVALRSIPPLDLRRDQPTPGEPLNKRHGLPQVSDSQKHHPSVQMHGSNHRSAEQQPQLVPKGFDGHLPAHPTVQCPPPLELRDKVPSPWEMGNICTTQLAIRNIYLGGQGIQSSGWSDHDQFRTRYPGTPVKQVPMLQMHAQNESPMGVPTIPPFVASHRLPPNIVVQNVHASGGMPPSLHLYCDLKGPSGMTPGIPPMSMLPSGLAISAPAAYSYYPLSIPVAQPTHLWSGMADGLVSDCKLERAERREAALSKFRQKRKDRCFEKKIRYVSRKRLAEQRPRNRGQFVRRNNGSGTCEDVGVEESENEDNGSSCDAFDSGF